MSAGGPGLVAVGIDFSGGDQDGAVWVSTDGSAWSRIPHDEALFGGADHQQMRSVAAGGPGVVAVGTTRSAVSDLDVVVWVSTDGLAWARVDDEAVFGMAGAQWVYSVIAGGPRLVAVGVDASDGDGDGGVWVSTDGYVWAPVDDAAGLGGAGDQWIERVTVGGPGLVAVGWDGSAGDPDGAVWVSPPPG